MSEKATLEKSSESPSANPKIDVDDGNAASSAAHESTTSPRATSKLVKPAVHFAEDVSQETPLKPPRPLSPEQQAQSTLTEAFPSIDGAVIKAVLLASGGKVEPAFNALLSMSDPDFKAEETPPPRPPRPQRTQMEQDELYARQLAQHYHARNREEGRSTQRQPEPEERSFFDDDLPEIRKNIEQGFKETQKTVNKWITNLTKRLDGEPDDNHSYGDASTRSSQRQNFGPSQSDQLHGIRKSAESRRSADHGRYDADNTVLGDDFAQVKLTDHEAPQRSSRPTANPDLFKPTPLSPPQSGPVDEVDALYRSPSPNSQCVLAKTGGKKWQPLTSIAPQPEPDDHDPFSLGDSDDDDRKTKDTNSEDAERLKKAAASKDAPKPNSLQPAEQTKSQDAEAVRLLKDTK